MMRAGRWSSHLAWVWVAALVPAGTVRAEDRRPVVAVFGIEDRSRTLDKKARRQLTDYLATRMGEGGRYRIVPPGNVRKRLARQQRESYRQCYDQGCQIELGHELAAHMTLATRVLHIGRKCQLTLDLYDLAKAATHKSSSVRSGCSPESLMDAVDRGLVKLGALDPPGADAVAPGKPRDAGSQRPTRAERRRDCNQRVYLPCVDRCREEHPREEFIRKCRLHLLAKCRARNPDPSACGGSEPACVRMCANDSSPGTCAAVCMQIQRNTLRKCQKAWEAYCPELPACRKALQDCLQEQVE